MPPENKSRLYWKWILGVVIVCAVIFVSVLTYFSIAPSDFPDGSTVAIEKGMTLSQAAKVLSDSGVIRSQFLFKVAVRLMGGTRSVVMGDYLFDQPLSVVSVALRTIQGQFGIERIKVTIPEGLSSKEMSVILAKNIPKFDAQGFVVLAKQYEGYLFPDTYYFYGNSTPESVVAEMRNNFENRMASTTLTLTTSAALSTRSMKDVIIMASIIEKEATSSEDRRVIAGILWKRLDSGMALQVDPPFYYFLGKTSDQLSVDDLALDSPYNLYKHVGLPPTPISNPGLDAITDTLNPSSTPYWFYLSDKKGNMHYASTFEGHVANKSKYL